MAAKSKVELLRRSGATPAWRTCRSGRWPTSTGCSGARCDRPSNRRGRRRARSCRRGVQRLDPFKPLIDQMLRDELDAPRKQRHTVKRIFDRLVAEHEMEGISYATVVDYVAERRPQVRVEAGRGPAQVFIRQTQQPRPGPRSTSVTCGSTSPGR